MLVDVLQLELPICILENQFQRDVGHLIIESARSKTGCRSCLIESEERNGTYVVTFEVS
jgi:hypothetical protein